MKFKLKDIDKKWKEYALAGCVCVLFFVVLTHLGTILSGIGQFLSVLKPIVLGFVIAYIVNPMAKFFSAKLFAKVKKEKLRWLLSVVLTLVIIIIIIVIIIASLIPQIVENVTSLSENYSQYISRLNAMIENEEGIFSNTELVGKVSDMILGDDGLLNKIGKILADNAGLIISKTTALGGAAVNVLVGVIFAIYFLLTKDSILNGISRFFRLILTSYKYESAHILVTKFNAIFSKYIVCVLLETLIVGIVNYIFMLITNMPDAVVISVVVGLTNMAPTFGPIVGMCVGAFILLLVKPAAIIPFVIFTLVLQTIDGYVIKPKLFGGALNVPGVVILISIIVFGKLMGVAGMLLSIPFAAIIVYIYTELFIPWLELKKDMKAYNKEKENERQ